MLPVPNAGLCAGCRNARLVESGKGSQFILCAHSQVDPSFPRYPRLPVRDCSAFRDGQPEPAGEDS